MALKHGNKSYYQVLIDPNRAELIEKAADKERYARYCVGKKGAYEALQREFSVLNIKSLKPKTS